MNLVVLATEYFLDGGCDVAARACGATYKRLPEIVGEESGRIAGRAETEGSGASVFWKGGSDLLVSKFDKRARQKNFTVLPCASFAALKTEN